MIKIIHVTTAILSISGFVMRGVWMWRQSPNLQQRWVKILPHVIDTILLVSAVILAIQTQQYPVSHDWLSAKVIGLVLYIGLGMVAFRFGKTMTTKRTAFITAVLVFAYILGVAVSRNTLIVSG
jgi:uncharacterized membrane protein SirB2